MLLWDTSAVVAALFDEDPTRTLPRLLNQPIIASVITPIEITSALWRRLHHAQISAAAHRRAVEGFASLSRSWHEFADLTDVVPAALDVLTRHSLRAADAIQLATAIVVANGKPAALPFVTLDRRLATAAKAEGFSVLP